MELGVAAEPGLVGRSERGRAPSVAVRAHEAVKSVLDALGEVGSPMAAPAVTEGVGASVE